MLHRRRSRNNVSAYFCEISVMTYILRNGVSVNQRAAFRHGAQKADRDRREDPQTLFNAGVHEWEIAEDIHVNVGFCLDSTANLVYEALQVMWVAEKMVCQAAKFSGRCLTSSDTVVSRQ